MDVPNLLSFTELIFSPSDIKAKKHFRNNGILVPQLLDEVSEVQKHEKNKKGRIVEKKKLLKVTRLRLAPGSLSLSSVTFL